MPLDQSRGDSRRLTSSGRRGSRTLKAHRSPEFESGAVADRLVLPYDAMLPSDPTARAPAGGFEPPIVALTGRRLAVRPHRFQIIDSPRDRRDKPPPPYSLTCRKFPTYDLGHGTDQTFSPCWRTRALRISKLLLKRPSTSTLWWSFECTVRRSRNTCRCCKCLGWSGTSGEAVSAYYHIEPCRAGRRHRVARGPCEHGLLSGTNAGALIRLERGETMTRSHPLSQFIDHPPAEGLASGPIPSSSTRTGGRQAT